MSVEEGFGKVAAACRALRLSRSSYDRSSRLSRERRAYPQGSARDERRASSLPAPAQHGADATGWVRGQCETSGTHSTRRRNQVNSTTQRQQAERPCQVWSWDFVADQAENGSSLPSLALLDEHSRQCLAIHPALSIRAIDVITVAAIVRCGIQDQRRDNGPEFIAYRIQDWLKLQRIKTIYVKPGGPWEDGHIESCHDKPHNECLNRQLVANCGKQTTPKTLRTHATSVTKCLTRGGTATGHQVSLARVNGRLVSPALIPRGQVTGRRPHTTPGAVGDKTHHSASVPATARQQNSAATSTSHQLLRF
jgi:transposase InsO family protein